MSLKLFNKAWAHVFILLLLFAIKLETDLIKHSLGLQWEIWVKFRITCMYQWKQESLGKWINLFCETEKYRSLRQDLF
jgi:hypothetical protein